MTPSPSLRRSRGRPLGFDRGQALDAMMRLFWRHGYDGVSFGQILAKVGVSKPSVYASFGNKEALFTEALDLYRRSSPLLTLSCIVNAQRLAEAVSTLLRSAAEVLLESRPNLGCMILGGSTASHPDNEESVALVARQRFDFLTVLSCRLRAWLPQDEADTLARCLLATMQGMSIQARDGATAAELRRVADRVATALTA